jgi:hypothetical protein
MNKLVDQVVSSVVKEAGFQKSAKVFDPGEIVTLVDQIQGLNKGSKYKVVSVKPGRIVIAQLNITDGQEGEAGDVIGEFDSSRFVRHNDEY